MTIINLRDFYYWYTQDEYIEVSDDVAEALRTSVRYEAVYTERARYNKAYYSLDADDGIEYSACLHELTPDEVLELKERFCRLWNALNSLPEIQSRRVDAHFILGMTYRELASPTTTIREGQAGRLPLGAAAQNKGTPGRYLLSFDGPNIRARRSPFLHRRRTYGIRPHSGRSAVPALEQQCVPGLCHLRDGKLRLFPRGHPARGGRAL